MKSRWIGQAFTCTREDRTRYYVPTIFDYVNYERWEMLHYFSTKRQAAAVAGATAAKLNKAERAKPHKITCNCDSCMMLD